MTAIICPDCLTRSGAMSLSMPGEPCRRCGVVPEAGVLTVREVRGCCDNAAKLKRAGFDVAERRA